MTSANNLFQFEDLNGRFLLITGISRGIGRALLPGLLEQGIWLVAIGREMQIMEDVRAELGLKSDRLKLFQCDLSQPGEVEAVGRAILAEGIVLDALLHNAAIDPRAQFEKAGQSHWSDVFQVNVFSAMSLTRAFLPSLRSSGSGRIIFTGSVMDQMGGSLLTAYSASKAALAGATRSLAHELKGTGITVNGIIPGAIQVEKDTHTEEDDRLIRSWQAVDRRLNPGDLLGLICLLLSSAGSAISGQTITVDGGLLHPLVDPVSQATLLPN